MENRKPIESFPIGPFKMMKCNEEEVRELEADYKELEEKLDYKSEKLEHFAESILRQNDQLAEKEKQIKLFAQITISYDTQIAEFERERENKRERLKRSAESVFEERNKNRELSDMLVNLREQLETMSDFLQLVSNWKNAYPEDVFPPIGNDTYRMMCKASGISVDRVSAHVLRFAVKGYSETANKLLRQMNNEI